MSVQCTSDACYIGAIFIYFQSVANSLETSQERDGITTWLVNIGRAYETALDQMKGARETYMNFYEQIKIKLRQIKISRFLSSSLSL